MTTILSQCAVCKHLRDEGGACDAFPDGIPMEVMFGDGDPSEPESFKPQFDHRQPYPGDNGVRWEAADPELEHPLA
jgi:hypothetical protein